MKEPTQADFATIEHVTFGIEKPYKDHLRRTAAREGRSQRGQVAHIVRLWCEANGVPLEWRGASRMTATDLARRVSHARQSLTARERDLARLRQRVLELDNALQHFDKEGLTGASKMPEEAREGAAAAVRTVLVEKLNEALAAAEAA